MLARIGKPAPEFSAQAYYNKDFFYSQPRRLCRKMAVVDLLPR